VSTEDAAGVPAAPSSLRAHEAPADAPVARQQARAVAPPYAGLVTRTVAFALDAAAVNFVAIVVGVVLGLALSILHLPPGVRHVLEIVGAAAWVLWLVSYFAFFWSTTGQTPGDRVLGIVVVDERTGRPLGQRQAVLRFGCVLLAALPLLAGFLIMLWDDRRRCLQDRMTHTVVIDTAFSKEGDPVVGVARDHGGVDHVD
jgi:Mce-associated membrane protein